MTMVTAGVSAGVTTVAPSCSAKVSPAGSTSGTPQPASAGGMLGKLGGDDMSAMAAPPLDPGLLVSLAAVNHLCAARVRLLAMMPFQKSILWCGRCGALREGYGGAEPRLYSFASPGKRKASALDDDDSGSESLSMACDEPADELERELQRTLAAMAGEPPKSPVALTPSRRRKASNCTACGERFRRPFPSRPPMPSARAVARTRRQSRLASEVTTAEPEEPLEAAPASAAPSGKAEPAGATPMSSAPSTAPPSPKGSALSRTPPLSHIPHECGTTPTYPKPPVQPPPGANGASTSLQLPPSPPPPKKRKVKKSGLAKLLAQNAQRQAEKSSGDWGLG